MWIVHPSSPLNKAEVPAASFPVWSALGWIATTAPVTSAPRNTKEPDTGWLLVDTYQSQGLPDTYDYETLGPPYPVTYYEVRRQGARVYVRSNGGLSGVGPDGYVVSPVPIFPVGFRPSAAAGIEQESVPGVANAWVRVYSTGLVTAYGGDPDGPGLDDAPWPSMTWLTDDQWPTNLPGTSQS